MKTAQSAVAAGIIWLIVAWTPACREGRTQDKPESGLVPHIAEKPLPENKTIESRFPAPPGFERIPAEPGSFAAYLRGLPLKPQGAEVRLFDGRVKSAAGVYAAVVDLPIGNRDLHQCADAVIRLRAEYLFAAGRPDDIRFHFTNGFEAAYSRWRRGERISAGRDGVRWTGAVRTEPDDGTFRGYLETVFAYAGTASLAAELDDAAGDDPEIGDVFIRGGHPGHAVIVVDKASDSQTGRSVFLLAQSYMPAQDIQVLVNPNEARLSPWYAAGFGDVLQTPQWTFTSAEKKRF
ncbi:MAG: DUF4846 domain-containing protein [Candidatus Aminicenantes bacterium]|nr:DUF4846 domain-containing protein [Candidatus Aminicenantes bacterium]